MSSMYLLKDQERGKRGQIVSVPFVVGRDMIAKGLAIYPSDEHRMQLLGEPVLSLPTIQSPPAVVLATPVAATEPVFTPTQDPEPPVPPSKNNKTNSK